MQDMFDENGNAIATTTLTVWGYGGLEGEFTGAYDVRILAGTGIPGLSTLKPAPTVREQEVAVYANDQWTVAPDYREETVYSTAKGEPTVVDYIGAIRDGFTLTAPSTPFDKWNGSAWVTDVAAQHRAQVQDADTEKAMLLTAAQSTISLWQTRLQLGIISDEDKSRLIAWMNYIQALNAVDTSVGADVVWPAQPQT